MILAPMVKDRKGEYSQLFEDLRKKGFSKVRVDGQVKDLTDDFVLIKTNRHTIDVVVDRLVLDKSIILDKSVIPSSTPVILIRQSAEKNLGV